MFLKGGPEKVESGSRRFGNPSQGSCQYPGLCLVWYLHKHVTEYGNPCRWLLLPWYREHIDYSRRGALEEKHEQNSFCASPRDRPLEKQTLSKRICRRPGKLWHSRTFSISVDALCSLLNCSSWWLLGELRWNIQQHLAPVSLLYGTWNSPSREASSLRPVSHCPVFTNKLAEGFTDIFAARFGSEILTLQAAISVLGDAALPYETYHHYWLFYHLHPTSEKVLNRLNYQSTEEGKKFM